jgi:tight adherence protein B
MTPTITLATTFLATCAGAAIAWSLAMDLFFRNRFRINQRLNDAFSESGENLGRKTSLFKDLKLIQAETARTERGLWQKFRGMIEQSGVEISPERLLLAALPSAIVSAILGGLLSHSWRIALAASAAGSLVPFFYVYRRRNLRVYKLRMQLPGAFEMMSRAVRAGQTMSGAVQLVADQSKPPISHEFGLCCEQQNLGLPHDVALKDLARRTGVMELQMFVVAMLVQRQSGGNPVEVLNNLSLIVRKRSRLAGRVKALTGEGRMQALVLSLLPVIAFVALFLLNRAYVQILLDRPHVLGGVVVAEVLGTLWIRKVINFEY